MAKADERSDGLEIISIGALYNGAWEKKYWSSSRGKDRYPFPIGYKAARSHNGITYQMEIHEGSKGPSFSITSTDGHSCSGQTPDMAWDMFQKKGCPRIKLWRGKRFSCKIDGGEFFGFKNAFVQRLLRGLVSHDGITTEYHSVNSVSITEDSSNKNQQSCAESCTEATKPALVTSLEIPQVKGKRSRKLKSVNPNPIDAANCKKIRSKEDIPNDRVLHKNVVHDSGTSDSVHKNHNILKHEPSLTPSGSNEEHEFHNDDRASVASMNLDTLIEEKSNSLLDNNDLPVISCHSSAHHSKGEDLPHKEDKMVKSITTRKTADLSIYENPLDRPITENESSISIPEEPKEGEVLDRQDTEGTKTVDLCVPDSFDSLHADRTWDSQSNSQKEKKSPSSRKSELVAGVESVAISTKIASESHQGEETSIINANFEKNDSDSVGEDIMKSMMSFLLPQALPLLPSNKKSPTLLKTFSKKRRVLKLPENSIGRKHNHIENPGPDNRDGVSPEGVHANKPLIVREMDSLALSNPDQGLDVFSSGNEATVVPGTFINDKACSDIPRADLSAIDDNKNKPNQLLLPASSDAFKKSSMCHGSISFSDKSCKGQKESVEKCMKASRTISGLGVSSSENNFYRNKVNELKTSLEHDKGAADDNSCSMVSSWEDITKGVITSGLADNSYLAENPNATTLIRQSKSPLSESIICRSSTDVFLLQTHAASKLLLPSDDKVCSLDPVIVGKIDPVPEHQEFGCPLNKKVNADLINPLASFLGRSEACDGNESPRHPNHSDEKNVSEEKHATSFNGFNREVTEGPRLKPQMTIEQSGELANLRFVGRYVHPFPVSLVLLSTNEKEVCICVLCDASVEQDRKLFLYKVSIKDQMSGSPSFIGYTVLRLPFSRDAFGREISTDRTCLQLTPDGHSLVLLNSVKAPCCREGNYQCPCTNCVSSCNGSAGLKVVQVQRGYVSVTAKLTTTKSVQCVLACEPNYLIGIDESGTLHLWVMNLTWSAPIEECDLSTSDCIFPCIVELKRVPNSAALILGHNGFGEFGLWDIGKRICVAKFSSPTTSVFQFLPISVFRWQRTNSVFAKPRYQGKEQNTDIMASKRSLSKQDENQPFNLVQEDDFAIWILISTICNSDTKHESLSSDHKRKAVGFWRLALVAENRVILGNAMDHRVTAIGASTRNGIVGTNNGVVYVWDLSTGTKLCDLNHFQGASVSCIAADDSKAGPIAIAGGNQLQVYVRSDKDKC